MNSKNYIIEDIPEEIDNIQINPIIGEKSPIIKPKLDDTLPSILNLSSEKPSFQKSRKISYNNEEFKYYNGCVKSNSIIPMININQNFNKTHCKSNSNEVFLNPSFIKFLESTQETEKNHKKVEDDDSSYYSGEFKINEVVNFWNESHNEKNEFIKKKLFVDNEDGNQNEYEEEGLFILNMLKKGNSKK